ncbi:Protein of unknown function [Dyella sp. OK004]|uniref:DUF1045 domain-containing protein n=1 Tax=Dyella sp. OK004 TaxID=1855292 RepID=UPI0008ED2993|nr:DUF1045 domain-containing protein [Dyella sp. OK004]SFS19365.1 Protein of unknown function [Dyella sp. OK004]
MRYAIYYCPAEDSELGQLGSAWLAQAGEGLPVLDAERSDALLADVRRYGWHATLRAPFELVEGASYAALRDAVAAVATAMPAFDLSLQLDRLAGFLALRPRGDSAAVDALAEACLHALEPLRAPPPAEALQRRAVGIDATEHLLLQRYGYPFVLDRYRFHMTLSAPATAPEEQRLREWLAPRVGALGAARVDALAICGEISPGSSFNLIERIALQGAKAA